MVIQSAAKHNKKKGHIIMDNEIWKELIIYGVKTDYIISSKGRIKNIITNNILKPRLNHGYLRISLKTDNGSRNFNVAILMMHAFKNKEKEDEMYLYFYDGNRLNLDIDNIDILDIETITDLENKKLFKKKGEYYVLRNGNKPNELWKQLTYDGRLFHYMISSIGRIMNSLTGLFLTPTVSDRFPYPSL